MNYEQIGDKVVASGFKCFNIAHILECGQCFRFVKVGELDYIVIAHSKVIRVSQIEDTVQFYPATIQEFEEIWVDYFDLNRDYEEIKGILSEMDEHLHSAVNYAGGIRFLNQQTFECLISFIISQNNRIPMIQKVVDNIAVRFGDKINEYHAFPSLEQIKNSQNLDFMECKAGFRAKYIVDAIQKIANGEVDLNSFNEKSTDDLKTTLMTISGIGPKVADCIMLFSCRRYEVFPTDVWVKRVVSELYFAGKDISLKDIQGFAKDRFGNYAGFANQFLFHYARNNRIGTGK